MRMIGFVFVVLLALGVPASAVEMGDDGLHKPTWLEDTFLDLAEDLAEAKAQDKRLLIIWEQRGCIYLQQNAQRGFPRSRH